MCTAYREFLQQNHIKLRRVQCCGSREDLFWNVKLKKDYVEYWTKEDSNDRRRTFDLCRRRTNLSYGYTYVLYLYEYSSYQSFIIHLNLLTHSFTNAILSYPLRNNRFYWKGNVPRVIWRSRLNEKSNNRFASCPSICRAVLQETHS